MSRRYIGKIGAICLVLTLCLAAIGVGYGHWTETLNIDGTVETGEVDVEFLNAVASDNEELSGLDDVGQTTVELSSTDGDGDFDWMQVNLTDGYYCYIGIVTFDVHNNGTVPVKVAARTIIEPAGEEVDVLLSGIYVGDVIDPGQTVPCTLTAHITADGSTGSGGFTVDIEVVNWNEGG